MAISKVKVSKQLRSYLKFQEDNYCTQPVPLKNQEEVNNGVTAIWIHF